MTRRVSPSPTSLHIFRGCGELYADAVLRRCRKYLDKIFLQYETRTSRAGQLKILLFYAFLGPVHISALLSRGNKWN